MCNSCRSSLKADPQSPVGAGEAEFRKTLEDLKVNEGHAVLMRRKEEHDAVEKAGEWRKVPWYGTPYKVETVDDELVKTAAGASTIPDLHLPHPNELIPQNLDVEKRDVAKDAIKLAKAAKEIVDGIAVSGSDIVDLGRIVPPGSNYVWQSTVPNLNEANSSLSYYLHFGSYNDRHLRAASALVAQILAEPVDDLLSDGKFEFVQGKGYPEAAIELVPAVPPRYYE
ncbi:hypothetical protein EWM64_g1326 [Hericium alpestre]|uniref:Peptidase M16 middle/third domain-containing protein n=1 Tax=Hericium alpestre TaxID=135208 RepID=A0A4Z0A6K5_9AGAM|nr:hypothetical protein EWM64_g1326 [Hericium alpestre]